MVVVFCSRNHSIVRPSLGREHVTPASVARFACCNLVQASIRQRIAETFNPAVGFVNEASAQLSDIGWTQHCRVHAANRRQLQTDLRQLRLLGFVRCQRRWLDWGERRDCRPGPDGGADSAMPKTRWSGSHDNDPRHCQKKCSRW
jgi:hypothetical protein